MIYLLYSLPQNSSSHRVVSSVFAVLRYALEILGIWAFRKGPASSYIDGGQGEGERVRRGILERSLCTCPHPGSVCLSNAIFLKYFIIFFSIILSLQKNTKKLL